MNNNKKKMLGLVLMMGVVTVAQAEVLVILPESGPMARAASSIQQGFLHVYQTSKQKTPVRFVDSHNSALLAFFKLKSMSRRNWLLGHYQGNSLKN